MAGLLDKAVQQNLALQQAPAPGGAPGMPMQQAPPQQTMAPPPAPAQTPGPGPAPVGPGEAQAPGPQNSRPANLDKFVENSLKIIHTPQVSDHILNTIKQSPDKVDGVGNASVEVADRLVKSASESGQRIDPKTAVHGMNAIVGEVANLTETAGIAKLGDREKYKAYSWALSNFLNRSVKSGTIAKEDLMGFGQKVMQTKEGQAVGQQMGGANGTPR